MNKDEIKITTADPSALGLFGLAMVTLVAATQKLGITEGLSYLLPWVIFFGAVAQLIACLNDIKRNNVFGTTAFGGFGLYWFAIGTTWLIKLGFFGQGLVNSIDEKQLTFAFVGFLVFSLILTLATVEVNKLLFIILALIDVLFLTLSLGGFEIQKELMHHIAGCAELLISIFSFYGVAAHVLNNTFGRVFLPLGKPFGIFKK